MLTRDGIKFQGVPRQVLDHLLPVTSRPTSTARQTANIPKRSSPSQTSLSVETKTEIPNEVIMESGNFAKITAIICEEVGASSSELKAETEFADLGIDSLLALNILSRLREDLSLDLSPSLFLDFPTVKELHSHIGGPCGHEYGMVEAASSPDESSRTSLAIVSEDDDDGYSTAASSSSTGVLYTSFTPMSAVPGQDEADFDPMPQATVSRLCGKPEGAKAMLILFPDGAGSATAYASLALCLGLEREPSDIVVYGLNCPWLKNGAQMTKLGITIETMAAVYLDSVRQIVKDHKPPRLAFGGWSAGGVLAYEALCQLHKMQDQQAAEAIDDYSNITVDKLVFFDSPNPIGLQNPPTRMYSFFSEIGVFGSTVPSWLFAHFEAFLRALDGYKPVPMTGTPNTSSLIFYARDGVCKDPDGPKMDTQPDDPREMLWLLNNRTDFSADGWASLVPGGPASLWVRVLEGVNHFTMMSTASALKEMGRVTADFILH